MTIKKDILIDESEKCIVDVVVLTETKKKRTGDKNIGNDIHIWSGVEKRK